MYHPESRVKTNLRQKPVELGAIQGPEDYQVLDGVKPGDEIAVTQILNLQRWYTPLSL